MIGKFCIFVALLICLALQSVHGQSTFARQCLDRHNTLRARHGAPPLVLDDSLTNYAQEWANNLANIGASFHRPNNDFGESIFAAWGNTPVDGAVPVQEWYNEISRYNWNNPSFTLATGHFSALVWRSTQRLGCAIARNGDRTYVVANYDPSGNQDGQFRANVLPAN